MEKLDQTLFCICVAFPLVRFRVVHPCYCVRYFCCPPMTQVKALACSLSICILIVYFFFALISSDYAIANSYVVVVDLHQRHPKQILVIYIGEPSNSFCVFQRLWTRGESSIINPISKTHSNYSLSLF